MHLLHHLSCTFIGIGLSQYSAFAVRYFVLILYSRFYQARSTFVTLRLPLTVKQKWRRILVHRDDVTAHEREVESFHAHQSSEDVDTVPPHSFSDQQQQQHRWVKVIYIHLDHRSSVRSILFPSLTSTFLSSSDVRVIRHQSFVSSALLVRVAHSRMYKVVAPSVVVIVFFLVVYPQATVLYSDAILSILIYILLLLEATRWDRTLIHYLLRTFQFWLLLFSIILSTGTSTTVHYAHAAMLVLSFNIGVYMCMCRCVL